MLSSSEGYGSDEHTPRNVFEIILVLIGLAIMGFLWFNTTMWEYAEGFWFLGLTGLLFILAAFVIGKGKLDFDVLISGNSLLPINKKYLYILFTIIGILTFLVMSQSSYRIDGPSFQMIRDVDVGFWGDIFYTTFAAIFEDVFFFVGVMGLIFTLIFWKTKNTWLGLSVTSLITVSTFTVYHLNRYGLDSVETWAVAIFAFEMVLAMIILRDVTYVHVRHVANNIGILIFEAMDMQTLFIALMGSWIFWLFLIIFLVTIAYTLMRRRK